MQLTLQTTNQILRDEDIEGLIEAGAPEDEYQDEAAQIVAALLYLDKDAVTQDAIISIISLIWIQSFNLAKDDLQLRVSAIERVAQAILATR